MNKALKKIDEVILSTEEKAYLSTDKIRLIEEPVLTSYAEDLLLLTFTELGQRKEKEDIQLLARILARDLREDFKHLSREEVSLAFRRGIRDEDFYGVNARTWSKWIRAYIARDRREAVLKLKKVQALPERSDIDKKETLRLYVKTRIVEGFEEYRNEPSNTREVQESGAYTLFNTLKEILPEFKDYAAKFDEYKSKARPVVKERIRAQRIAKRTAQGLGDFRLIVEPTSEESELKRVAARIVVEDYFEDLIEAGTHIKDKKEVKQILNKTL